MILLLDFDLLLGFQGLVKAVAVAPAGHEPAGELVDDDDLAVFDHVIDIALEDEMGLEGLVDAVDKVHLGQIEEVGDVKGFFGGGHAFLQKGNRPGFFVDLEVFLGLRSRRTTASAFW